MRQRGWKPFAFQCECWDAIANNLNGFLHAPTGSGKTYALFLAALSNFGTLNQAVGKSRTSHIKVIWITPLKALASDIAQAMTNAVQGMNVGWSVGVRTGDTSQAQKQKQRKELPDALVITPESLHVLLSYADTEQLFANVKLIVVDEWHELMATKRGVQTELALAHLRSLSPQALVWGISATIGNLDQAVTVLHGSTANKAICVTAEKKKQRLTYHTLMPKTVERSPWTGNVGLHMLDQVEKVIRSNQSTLVFTNTRSQAEVWYQNFLEAYPEYAGIMAMHHGSMDRDVREWVEQQLKKGTLKVVFCTSSLDLGVDYPTVDAIIQIGSPKGVARFLQRAGRSGHNPGAQSKAWFLPTHALEIIEGAALRVAIEEGLMESRIPYIAPMDVLAQWLVTLACGSGFDARQLLCEVRCTHAYAKLTHEEWQWTLDFVTNGGSALAAYPDYKKVVLDNNRYLIANRTLAARHRMQIGTITSDLAMTVAMQNGRSLGTVEEGFISRLSEGDTFLFAGRALELVCVHEMTAYVKPSNSVKGAVARWSGGRIPLSSQMSDVLRRTVHEVAIGIHKTPEVKHLKPLLELQATMSAIPQQDQLLIEQFRSSEGYHVFFYPFEGRLAHEGLAALLAYRVSQQFPITFSMAMNDYAIELVADRPWSISDFDNNDVNALKKSLFSPNGLAVDILNSANMIELARRRFRDIARIAGLIFQGYPGRQKKARHLQSSSGLFFDVFRTYDSTNILLRQAHNETLQFQLDEERIAAALHRIQDQQIIIKDIAAPTPFCAPVLVDRLREKLGSERTEDRIKRLIAKGLK